jgi:hypothetical protein
MSVMLVLVLSLGSRSRKRDHQGKKSGFQRDLPGAHDFNQLAG